MHRRDRDPEGTGRRTEDDADASHTRRRYLAGLAAAGAAAVAGCSGGDGGGGGNGTNGTTTGNATGTGGQGQPAGGSVLTNVPSGPCQEPPRESTSTFEEPRYVESDTTFGTDADVVRFDGGLTVGFETAVTIEPGTTLEFGEGSELRVQGTLEAAGSCEAPIFLTGQADGRGAWDGVVFEVDGAGTLDHVLVENGGTSDGAGVAVRSIQGVTIEHSEIRGSPHYGVRIDPDATVDAFAGNGITGNAEPLWLAGWHAHLVGADNALTGNDTDRVHVLASVDYPIAEGESRTWADPGIPYYLTQGDRYTFAVNGDLTLDPGVELRFDQANGMLVRGSLNAAIPDESLPAEGPMASAPDDAIVFRGAQATRGYWEGLMFENTQSADNVLSGVVVRHAGGQPQGRGIYQEPAGVSVLLGSRLTIDGALIEQNGGYGVFANKDNELQTVARARIRDNADPAQVFFTTLPALATSSSYAGNDTDRVEVVNPTNAIEQSLTVPAIDVPYRVSLSQVGGFLQIAADLTIPDGTEIQFGQGAGIDVTGDGSLRIEGSETGDGGRTTVLRGEEATPGYWMGIRYFNTVSQNNVIDGAEIRHTGYENWAYIEPPSRAAVAGAVAAEATVRNCLIADFEGGAFRTSDDRPSSGDQTSTLHLSNNVVR